MGCSGKSIGCKSAALSPVALHLVPAPKLKCIIPTFQRQLLTPTSMRAPRIFLFTQSSPWNILNFVDTWKRVFCILPFSGPPVLPRTTSFYTPIISRISSFCLHPVPGIPGKFRIICLLCLHDSLYEPSANKENLFFVLTWSSKFLFRTFPGSPVVKNPPANAGDMGSLSGPGRPHVPRGN